MTSADDPERLFGADTTTGVQLNASTSTIRLYTPSAVLLTRILIWSVTTGEAKTTFRLTRLFPVMTPPGTSTKAAPFQYCTWKFVSPSNVKVVVFVGSIGLV